MRKFLRIVCVLQILSYDVETEMVNKETQQGKTLLHTEYTLLSLLTDLDGVIHHHGLFCVSLF